MLRLWSPSHAKNTDQLKKVTHYLRKVFGFHETSIYYLARSAMKVT